VNKRARVFGLLFILLAVGMRLASPATAAIAFFLLAAYALTDRAQI